MNKQGCSLVCSIAFSYFLLISGCRTNLQSVSTTQQPETIGTATGDQLPVKTGIPPPDTPLVEQEIPNTPVPTPFKTPRSALQPDDHAPQGFILLEGKHTSLYLPGTFIGGSPDEDLEAILELVGFLGPNYRQAALIMEQNKDLIDLFAIDTRLSKTGTVTNLVVLAQEVPANVDLEECAKSIMTELAGSGFKVMDDREFSMIHYRAVRLIIEKEEARQMIYQVIYITKVDRDMWFLTYTCGLAEAEKEQAEFDASARTFWVTQISTQYSWMH